MLKITALTAGAVFLGFTVLNIYLFYCVIHNLWQFRVDDYLRVGRGNQIYMGFEVLALCPVLPYICGVCFSQKDLIVPYMIGTLYSAIITLVFVGLSGYYRAYYPKIGEDIIYSGMFDSRLVSGYLCAIAIIHFCSFVVAYRFWDQLNTVPEVTIDKKFNRYAYRRFESAKV